MSFSAEKRQREEEWMDQPNADPEHLRKSLSFIRQMNILLRYTRATLGHLEQFSQNWSPGQRVTLLDVATGSADIPRAILRWADRRGFDVHVTAVDLHARTAELAAQHVSPRLRVMQADAMKLPFEDGAFDYVLTAMFLHHLDDDAVVQVLREMNRVARRGVIVADLLRHRRAYAWISLFTLLANPMVRHDARVSVAQAFSKEEVLALRERAELGYAGYFQHFGHRFVLAGQKDPGR